MIKQHEGYCSHSSSISIGSGDAKSFWNILALGDIHVDPVEYIAGYIVYLAMWGNMRGLNEVNCGRYFRIHNAPARASQTVLCSVRGSIKLRRDCACVINDILHVATYQLFGGQNSRWLAGGKGPCQLCIAINYLFYQMLIYSHFSNNMTFLYHNWPC